MSESESAIVTQKRGISRIWIVPIAAALIGVWMIYQHLNDRGVTITISMPNAEGISPGKTLIKTRSVPIGLVSSVRLADSLEGVEVVVAIEKPYIDLLKSDSQIWSVQPRIDESGISGLNTILSGIYFELQPGKADTTAEEFALLDSPPLVSQNVKGRRYQLSSNTAEVLRVGSPIMFKGFKVGSIEQATFDWYSETMHYQVFIEDPYFNLATENSFFWVESGIEFDLSADGIGFKTGALSKLLGGAITFGRPEREPKGDVALEGHRYTLSASYKEGLEERYEDFKYYMVMLNQSVRGLRVNAPLEYRGLRVGTVVEVPALLERDGKPHFISENNQLIPVLVKVEFARIFHDAEIARDFWLDSLPQWIENGLRVSLQTGSLLTGALFLELDLYPDEEPSPIETIAGYQVLPGTRSGGLSQLSAQMSEFLKKLNNLELEKILTAVDTTLSKMSGVADQAERLVEQTNRENIPLEVNRSLKTLRETLSDFKSTSPLQADIRKSLQSIEALGHDFRNGAPMYEDIRRTLKALERLSDELQPFSKSLNEHPSILIFDKLPSGDVQPTKGLSDE